MGLLTLIPGDKAVHLPTDTRVEITGYADGSFTAAVLDAGDRVTGQRITGSVAEFVTPNRTPAPKPDEASDAWMDKWLSPDNPANQATAQRIADLQAQITDLQKKLQQAEASRDEAASRAAELLAQPEPAPKPAAITAPRIEVLVENDIGERELAQYLNDRWTVMHMQFAPERDTYADGGTRGTVNTLHVVLQRTTTSPPPQPEARAAAVRTVTGAVVPMSKQIGDDDEYEDDDVPPLPALDPLMPATPKPALNTLVADATVPAADFTRAVLSARLPPAQTLELLNARMKNVARAAFDASPAPAPYKPLGAVK